MRVGELARKLRGLGMTMLRQGRAHEIWVNPQTGRRTSIPRHRNQELSESLVTKMVSELGLNRDPV